jgi:hypothetical protein
VANLVRDREPVATQRRVVARALGGVQQDVPLGGQQHPGAVAELPALLDAQAEQILGDPLYRDRQLLTTEQVHVSLADGVRARVLVLRHRHVHHRRSIA